MCTSFAVGGADSQAEASTSRDLAPPGTSIQRGSNRVMSRRNQKSGYVLLLHIERARHIELITSPPISCTGWVGSTPSNPFASSVSTCLYSLNGADPHCSPPLSVYAVPFVGPWTIRVPRPARGIVNLPELLRCILEMRRVKKQLAASGRFSSSWTMLSQHGLRLW